MAALIEVDAVATVSCCTFALTPAAAALFALLADAVFAFLRLTLVGLGRFFFDGALEVLGVSDGESILGSDVDSDVGCRFLLNVQVIKINSLRVALRAACDIRHTFYSEFRFVCYCRLRY